MGCVRQDLHPQRTDGVATDGLTARRVGHHCVLLVERGDPFRIAGAGALDEQAREELGVGILSESMTAHDSGQLVAAVIDDIETAAILALVWSATPSPALRQLLGHSRAAFSLGPKPGSAR